MCCIYVLDYSVDSIFEVEIKDADPEIFDCEQAEQILVELGFKLSDIHYMITEFNQELIKINYNNIK